MNELRTKENDNPLKAFSGKYIYLIIVFMLFNNTLIYSSAKSDSLWLIIENNPGNLKIHSLNYAELSKEFFEPYPDSSLAFAKLGLQLGEKAGYNPGILKNCIQLGRIAMRDDNLELSEKYFNRAAFLIRDNTEVNDQMRIWNGLGLIFDLRSDFSKALESYMRGMSIAEKSGSKQWLSYFYNNMAVIYDRTGYYRKGLVYFQKALALFTQLKDSANLANALNNIGLVYKELKLDDSARYFFYKSLPMQLRLKNYYGIINLNNNLGELMLEAKKYHEALRYFQISQETIRNDDSLFWGSKLYLIVATDFEMAKTFQQMKENTRALGYYRKVDSSAGTAGFLAFKTGALKGLSEVFDQTGDADSALKYARLHLVYYDSLRKIEDNQRMAVIEYEFNYKMEKEKEQLEKERQEALENRKELKFMLIIFTIVALSVLLFLLYLLQRNKLNRINLVKMNLQLEKSNLQKDLDLKNRELTTKVMSLIEQNELLAYLSQRLTKIIQTSDTKDSGLLHDVVHDIQYQHSEGFWEEFNLHFKEVHGDFYNRLSKAYPQLTLNEIKLCAFLKLNLSTKEISKVTRKSEQSLKIARYRLRQKLDLNREDNLTIFLSKF